MWYQKCSKNNTHFRVMLGVLSLIVLGQAAWGAGPKLLYINYGDLIDPAILVRTGEPLGTARKKPGMRGAVQPYLAPWSVLLNDAVDMFYSPGVTYHSITDHFPENSVQPAWVAIVRGGQISVFTDNNGHARVFLPGQSPQASYRAWYPALRHVLNTLCTSARQPLTVEIYAFTNHYAQAELRLNPVPLLIKKTYFGRIPDQTPINLGALNQFLMTGQILTGIQLNETNGVQFLGNSSRYAMTLAGQPVSLADFAVAYRSVFYSGDNAPFISLDPHRDPTRVQINFGGYLENTRIGWVILAADKRFKTITSGLDPDSYQDMRATIRSTIPDFSTCSEMDIAQLRKQKASSWTGTRLWFYPESIRVDFNPDTGIGVIRNPRFTADAERTRDDYGSDQDFERRKKSELSPSIRTNIANLNANYDEWAGIFGEFQELKSVGRLMGITALLKRLRPKTDVDLDVLLTVPIPPCPTATEKNQLLGAALLTWSEDTPFSMADIKANTRIKPLSPIMDQPVSALFRTADQLRSYWAVRDHTDPNKISLNKAETYRIRYASDSVRSIMRSREDLKALISWYTDQQEITVPAHLKTIEQTISRNKTELTAINDRLEKLARQIIDSDSGIDKNKLIQTYNEQVETYNSRVKEARKTIAVYNRSAIHKSTIMEISGGINLEPDKFTINIAPSQQKNRNQKPARKTTLPRAEESPQPSSPLPAYPKAAPQVRTFDPKTRAIRITRATHSGTLQLKGEFQSPDRIVFRKIQ